MTVANDEFLRRLDLLQERLVLHVESEKARLARKHKRESSGLETGRKPAAKPAPTSAEPEGDSMMNLWKTMLEEKKS